MTELNLSHPRKSFHPNGVQFGWDATSIGYAQTCLRKYQYRMIEGWRGNQESEHLRFGKHFATALERYYKYVALGQDWLEALGQVVLEAMLDTWDRDWEETTREESVAEAIQFGQSFTQLRPDGKYYKLVDKGPWISTHASKNRENLIRSIIWYVDQFHDEAVTVKILADGSPAVEHSFKLPADDGIIFTGHIDRVVEYQDNPYVMDQKTTAQTITPRWFDQFKPHTQFSMYTFAGKAIFNLPVKGVIIDGAQIAVNFTRFERSVSMRTDAELNEWYDDSMFWIATAQRATIDNHFPMNPASCGNYGGCEFRPVCSRSPGLRENFLAASFNKSEPWDPMESR